MRMILVMAALAATLAMSACNTVAGVGKDVQTAGKVVTGAAKDASK